MNDTIEITQEERLQDLTRAYARLRDEINSGATVDDQKATALAQVSIAMSLLEREAYDEDEFEEDDEEEEVE